MNVEMNMFFLILMIIVCGFLGGYGLYFLQQAEEIKQKAESIKIEKDQILEEQKQERLRLFNQIENLNNQKAELEKEKNEHIESLNNIKEEEKEHLDNIKKASEQYVNTLDRLYSKAEKDYDNKNNQLKQECQKYENELDKLRQSLSAGVQAQLREREKEEKLDFYKLSVSDTDLEDIKKLEALKASFHQPVVLSKLIWSQYFLKQTSDLCNRVLGKEDVCGIYKITNIKTQQCYVGQALHAQDRWKQHIKNGLGIDASSTNKLYKAMQNDGVWSFTFELIEKCSNKKEELNEREAYWISMYQSDKYGYNSNRGIK